ncbi:MAG TPA: hypothetical protein VFD66_07340 [Verrucomicrobiae bacterium]|nr:hypothetical protein [Verrucomicrobiae bacterium]
MQFLKKNYEKILLSVVLLGLVVAVGFLPFRIENERSAQVDRRNKKFAYPVKPLPALATNRYEASLLKLSSPPDLDLTSTNKLLNPVRWVKGPNGPLRMEFGHELQHLEISRVIPLYVVISLDNVTVSETGARYVITVEQQAAAKPTQRGRKPYYVSPGDKKDVFNFVSVKGPPENPTDVILELTDSGERIDITRDKPFRRTDGYAADLRYTPENKSFPQRRIGDKLTVAGEEYNIVAITENEVVLSARSNGKKYTIRYNAAP